MKTARMTVLCIIFCLTCVIYGKEQTKQRGRSIINFNSGWTFARFPAKPGFIDYPDNISQKVWKIISKSSEENEEADGKAINTIDGNFATRWYSKIKQANGKSPFPQELVIDLSRTEEAAGFRLLQRQDGSKNGMVKEYELYLSNDQKNWGEPVSKGVFEASANLNEIKFSTIKKGRYLKLLILSAYNKDYSVIAELGLMKPMDLKEKSKWEDQFFIMHLAGSDITELSADELDKIKNEEIKQLSKRKWEKVNLPHTAFIEPLTVVKAWQGICYYEKKFNIPAGFAGKKVFITFEGMMQVSDVWLNGTHIGSKKGGYLPLIIDLTGKLKCGKENSILVRLDNQDNPLVPPGKPLSSLDFCYYSGIYRDVFLTVTEPLHITDAVYEGKPKSGGVYVTYPLVSKEKAQIDIGTHIKNEAESEKLISVTQNFLDKNKIAVASLTNEYTLKAGEDFKITQIMHVENPLLWSVDEPNLYTLVTIVSDNRREIDRVETRVGIRKINFTRERGFELNGKQVILAGTNRHQEYPYVGNAVPDNAHYRDIVKIKNAGYNIVRLAHYPQDPSVLDACDELGMLVFDCAPGWQFFNNDERFLNRTYQDIRDMVRRDRNHPCIAIWEASLNESYPPQWFRQKQHDIVKEEIMGDSFTGGDADSPGTPWDVPFAWFTETENDVDRMQDFKPSFPGIVREYGDYEFGGANSTTRVFRKEGEAKLLQAAWNYQWEHNKMMKKWPAICGDATWVMFDYNRGCEPKIEASGISDIFRIPCFSYYFFKSQIDPAAATPMVYIANYWDERKSPAKVVVYSNCEEVDLYLNGKLIASRKPDNGPDTEYGNLYKGGNPFDGGNSTSLKHPPFTFTGINFVKGELKAVGKIRGVNAAEYSARTPESPSALILEADLSGISFKAGVSDIIFVYAKVVDKNGTVNPEYNGQVSFNIKGDAKIIGPAKINAEAGIASVLLQSGSKKGNIIVTAKSSEGYSGSAVIKSE